MAQFPGDVNGTPVISFATIGSTNTEALAHARRGGSAPIWIVSERQSEGRGRRGRSWYSVAGNLHATVLLIDVGPTAALPGICFVAALALHDALLDLLSGLAPARLRLKWPNDVLFDGRKFAGILVEGTTIPDGRSATAIGIGVNCKECPSLTDYPATSLAASGFAVEPAALLPVLDRRLRERLHEWDRGAGFPSIRTAWLARAIDPGSDIAVRLSDRTVVGRFDGVDREGSLVLRRVDGTLETITAGDVFPVATH